MRKNQLLLDSDSDLCSIKGVIIFINRYTQQADVELEDTTILKKLNFFYHCEPSNLNDADLAFFVGDTVYLAKDGANYVVIGFADRKPKPCFLRRFFARTRKKYWDDFLEAWAYNYFYYWICFDEEDNVIIFEAKNYEGRTQVELDAGFGLYYTLEQNLALHSLITQSATKAFLMTNDYGFKERWVATPSYAFKEDRAVFNVLNNWSAPPPCDVEELPCPPNRFYFDEDKNILVWYGSYEIFIGALIVRMDTIVPDGISTYTHNCVAASGISISGGRGYETLPDTEWDIPLNMISGVNWVNDTEISFYLPYGSNRRPGQVTIDWVDYEWGISISADVTDYTSHWYWTENGFEKKDLALLDQTILDDSIEDKYEHYNWPDSRDCSDYNESECNDNTEIIHYQGMYKRTVSNCNGYLSNYKIKIFDENFVADTINKNIGFEEQKFYNAGRCEWRSGSCFPCGVGVYSCAIRTIPEQIHQKIATGLSSFWNSNNVAYFYEEKNREKCWAYASQDGTWRKVCGATTVYIYLGGPNQEDFGDCSWSDYLGCITFAECPDGLGKCFELTMPGSDWFEVENDHVDLIGSGSHGDRYKWIKESDIDSYSEPIIRKFKIDEEIEFDATKIYKTYYLDDRSTTYEVAGRPDCDSLGLLVAGKGVEGENIFWEVYYKGLDITEELLAKLGCTPDELDDLGLI